MSSSRSPRAGPGVDGVASVAAGRAQSGQLSSSPSLMLARSAGIPVKAFAAGYQKHPFTYFSLEGNPIREPRDMIGKTIATQPTAVILLKALLAKNGIAEDQVEVVKMGRRHEPAHDRSGRRRHRLADQHQRAEDSSARTAST